MKSGFLSRLRDRATSASILRSIDAREDDLLDRLARDVGGRARLLQFRIQLVNGDVVAVDRRDDLTLGRAAALVAAAEQRHGNQPRRNTRYIAVSSPSSP